MPLHGLDSPPPFCAATDHILTGPAALSYADAAAILARRTGVTVRHRCEFAECGIR